jgi:hypothetical protein
MSNTVSSRAFNGSYGNGLSRLISPSRKAMPRTKAEAVKGAERAIDRALAPKKLKLARSERD